MKIVPSILLVDDHPSIQITIGDALRDNGYEVTAVSNSAAALTVCRTRHFDLALIDLRMQGSMDGLVGSSRVDLQACKLEYSIVSPK